MLPAELAMVRLEEEVARASSYRRPLSLAILEVESVEPDLDEASHDEIFRALARVTETMLREIDVPFLFAADRIGAILPETGAVAAAVASGRILEAVSAGRFSDRRRQRRRALTDAVAVRLAVVSMSPTLATAAELVERATSTLQRMRSPR
jgi:PleD family two-component response regulator